MQVFGSIPESSSASTTGQAFAHGIQLDASGLIVDEGGGDQVKRLDHGLAEINDTVCLTFVETFVDKCSRT
jgi:hypothetical protein